MSVILKKQKIKYKDPDSGTYKGINAISDDNAADVINNYLDDHPDMMTTVKDNSISIQKLTSDLRQDILGTKAAVGGPLVASTVTQITSGDRTKIYVYMGESTDTYTNGNWYYYNGSAWVSGGVYNSTAIETDKTLTVADMAADAEVVGDKINNLNNAIKPLVYGTTSFSSDGSTIHSSINDQIKCNIPEGETFKVSVITHPDIGKYTVAFYYSDDTSETVGGRYNAIETFVAKKNITAIGFYVSTKSSEYVFNAFVFSDDSPMQWSSKADGIMTQIRLLSDERETFFCYSDFMQGGLRTDGSLFEDQVYRVSCVKHIIAPRDLVVSVNSGYKWGYIPFVDGTPRTWSGWKMSDVTISAGTEFVVQIASEPENTNCSANVNEFVSAITFKASFPAKFENVEEDISDISALHYTWYVYANNEISQSFNKTIYSLSTGRKIKLNSGSTISCDAGYKYRYFAFNNDGELISGNNNTWITSKTVMEQDCLILLTFVSNDPETVQTIPSLL